MENAEWPEEIDKENALKFKQEAEETLMNTHLKFEVAQVKEKLRRAECRLKILETEIKK